MRCVTYLHTLLRCEMRFLGLIGVFSLALLTGACNDDQGLEHEQNQRHKELQKSFEWSRQGRLIAANSCRNAEEALKAKARQEMELSLDQSMQCMLSDKGCYYAIPEHMDGAAPPEASGTDDNAMGPTTIAIPTCKSLASTKPTSSKPTAKTSLAFTNNTWSSPKLGRPKI